jgi:GDP-L-fucose synthase
VLNSLDRAARIFVAGHNGMVGAALCRRLRDAGFENVVTRTRAQLDLTSQAAVQAFLAEQPLDYMYIAAAKVGGIHANNTYRADFLYENLAIAGNLIHGAHRAGIQRLMFLGSSCIYPRDCAQPIREEFLLQGPLEATNEPYALAKIAGVKLCEAYNDQYAREYVSVMPTNLYGPGDNYDLNNSHVLPALLRKAIDAKAAGQTRLSVWGSGNPRREFLYVEDLADASVHLMQSGYAGGLINLGTGQDLSIRELATLVLDVVGLDAELVFDASRPDGTPRKLLDVSKLAATGWTARTSLSEGLKATLDDFLTNQVRA